MGHGATREVVGTQGNMRMGEESLGLDDDNFKLTSRNEVAAVAMWRGTDEVRFPLMEEGCLLSRLAGMAFAEDVEWMA